MLRQLRIAARSLAASPAFSLTVIATLALGIGANTAVFSAIDAVLLKPLPYRDADRLMLVAQHPRRNPTNTVVAPVRLADWSRENTSFETLTGYYTQDVAEISGNLPERLKQAFVAPGFLKTLGIAPALGRDFIDDEHRFGGPYTVLISDRYWRKRFQADRGVVGKQLRVGTLAYRIVGVMPPSFLFADRDVDTWSPVFMDAPFAQGRFNTWFTVIGRLKSNLTMGQAQANLNSVQAELGRRHGLPDSEMTVSAQPLKDSAIGQVRQSLWLVYGAVSVLLLIACTNIAALLLARATQREHEVAVRYSLGATRASVVMQVLAEAFVLSVVGSAAGLGVAAVMSRTFSTLAANLPRVDEIAIDSRILLYTLAAAVATTLLCGLVPAFRGSRRDTREGLTHAGRTQVSGRHSMQWMLVGVQVALAVTLLAGAGLLLRSFQELGRVSPGFDKERVLTFRMTASWAEDPNWATRARDLLEAVPGVERVATMFAVPGAPSEFPIEFMPMEGRAGDETKIIAEMRSVSPGYFDVMRIPLLQGEWCLDRPNPAFVEVMVNERFARSYFSAGNAVGRTFRSQNPQRPIRVQGIVADARETGLNKDPEPVLYNCNAPGTPLAMFAVRTRVEPTTMTETIRQQLRGIEPLRSAYELVPLETRLDEAFTENRLRTVLLTFFAATAVLLACVGLYGTLSYFVSLRRREVGLRLALGAGRGRIVRQFVWRGLAIAGLGCIAGLGLALAFTRVLAGMLFGVAPDDPLTLSAVVAAMIGVASLASLLPAARAAVLEPMQVLREE